MIEKFNGQFVLYCDICGEEANGDFDDFYEAVDYKKINGWQSQKGDGQWKDVCPECQKAK